LLFGGGTATVGVVGGETQGIAIILQQGGVEVTQLTIGD
jgi:hypothetical protein